MSKVTRVEVIDPEGRAFSRWYGEDMTVSAALQDDGRTVKIFVDRSEDLG